jgi:hypothetical protein
MLEAHGPELDNVSTCKLVYIRGNANLYLTRTQGNQKPLQLESAKNQFTHTVVIRDQAASISRKPTEPVFHSQRCDNKVLLSRK